MSIAQFWFNFSCAFSGQKYYTEGAIQMFNFLYTNFPLLLMGVYDMDILPSSAHKFPQIYLSGVNDEYFKVIVFFVCCTYCCDCLFNYLVQCSVVIIIIINVVAFCSSCFTAVRVLGVDFRRAD